MSKRRAKRKLDPWNWQTREDAGELPGLPLLGQMPRHARVGRPEAEFRFIIRKMRNHQGSRTCDVTRREKDVRRERGVKGEGTSGGLLLNLLFQVKCLLVQLLAWSCYWMEKVHLGMEQCYGPLRPNMEMGEAVPQQTCGRKIMAVWCRLAHSTCWGIVPCFLAQSIHYNAIRKMCWCIRKFCNPSGETLQTNSFLHDNTPR